MSPEYAWINPEDIASFVLGLLVIGAAVVGFLVGWMVKNWSADKLMRELEEQVKDVGQKK